MNRCTIEHCFRNSLPPINQYMYPRRQRRNRNSWDIRKASENSASRASAAFCAELEVVCKEFIDLPKRRKVVVSNVNRKNTGCKSMNWSVGMQLTKCSVCCSTCVKMFARLSENRGRNISRECFHGAVSCVKIPSPKSGAKVGRRAPRPYPATECQAFVKLLSLKYVSSIA